MVVVSQECDLEWDFGERSTPDFTSDNNKALPEVVVCEGMPVQLARDRGLTEGLYKRYRKLQDERYHWTPEVPAELDGLGIGVPELILDFKRLRTMPTEELYARLGVETGSPDRTSRRCRLATPHREKLSDRFYHFHARVALPSQSDPSLADTTLVPSS